MKTIFQADQNISEGDARSLKYLDVFYLLSIALFSFFVIKINLQFGLSQYNKYFFPLLGVFLLTPVIFRFTKNPFVCTHVFLFSGSSLTFSLIAASGGLASTGLIWLSVYPLIGGILLKKRGVYIGILQILIGLVGFYALGLTDEHCTDLVELLHKKELFAYESSIDLVAFSFFNIFIAYFFLTGEIDLNNKLLLQKNSTESLLRVVFHDIAGRASVIGFAQQNLKRLNQSGDHLPESKLKHLTRLESATNEMTGLLDVIRRMSALRDGKEKLNLIQADAVTLLKEAADLMSVASEQKNINFNIEVPDEKLQILTDPTIFKNIIVGNIISNAIKFSNENSKIDLRIYRNSKSIRIEIQDYGIGMSQDMIEGIFSIHSKTNRKGTNGEPGTGYGMPLAKEYVEKMGGKISIISSLNKSMEAPLGSTLILEFPSI